MDKLRSIIVLHSRWAPLEEYIIRIEASKEQTFSLALENAKALVESICKEICMFHNRPLDSNSNMNGVLKNAFCLLGYTNGSMVTKISSALSTIGQEVGQLRNEIGTTAHGKTLQELQDRESAVDLLTRDFLLDSIRTIAIFLIRSFEGNQQEQISPEESPSFSYDDFEEFNDWFDDSFGEFTMGPYSYPASQILYCVDNEAYHYERKQLEENDELE